MKNKLYEILMNLKENLTKMELDILQYKYSSNESAKTRYEIAERFNITPTRVLMHEKRILNKII